MPSLTSEQKLAVAQAAKQIRQEEKARLAKLRSAGRDSIVRNFLSLCLTILALTAILVFVLPRLVPPWTTAAEYVVVAMFSGLVAYGELVSRYQDSPVKLFGASSTPLYVIVNVAAGMAALGIIKVTGVLSETEPAWLYEILLASFGAIAFFRTSFFTVRVAGTDVGIGPSALLQALLNAADRMVDRDQAEGAGDVAEIMRLVDYNKARVALPVLCLILVQTPSASDQESLARQIDSLDKRQDIDDNSKSIILGVYLIRVVGPDVLQRSVNALGAQIVKAGSPDATAQPVGQPVAAPLVPSAGQPVAPGGNLSSGE